MSALIYSREALRESRETQAAEQGSEPQQISIFDQVPIDAPMPEGLVLGYWADWLGEFVSRERYLTSCPIDRVRAPGGEPCTLQPPVHKPTSRKRKAARTASEATLPGLEEEPSFSYDQHNHNDHQ